MKTLSEQIAELKFDYVYDDIERNFPLEPVRGGERKLFHFNKFMTSEDAVAEMAKDGYAPATFSELLAFAKDEWNGTDLIVALGSHARVRALRDVVCLGRDGSKHDLVLHNWVGGWCGVWRFLGVRQASVSPSDTLSLESLGARVQKLESLFAKEILR